MANIPEFKYAPMFQLGHDDTEYYLLTKEGVSVGEFEGHPILKVLPEALTMLSNAAFRDVSFLLRPAHNAQVAKILNDPRHLTMTSMLLSLSCAMPKWLQKANCLFVKILVRL